MIRNNQRMMASGVLIVCISSTVFADGGWATQTIDIQAGRNLIWLEVDPVTSGSTDPEDPTNMAYPTDVFTGIDLESIHAFEPGRLQGDDGAWVSFHPGKPAFVNTLKRIQGDRGYVVNVNTAPGAPLEIVGRPVNRSVQLSGQASNLFGARIVSDPGNEPTFGEYFSHVTVQGKVTSRYRWNGVTYESIAGSGQIQANTAYWINMSQNVSYRGPIQVKTPLDGYQFGINGYSEDVFIEVPVSPSPQTLTVRAISSATPPGGTEPNDAGGGDVSWLEYYDEQAETWNSLSAGASVTVPANASAAELEIRALRRQVSTPATLTGTNSLYQGLIEVTDNQNNRVMLRSGMEVQPVHGVWIGQARLNQVSTQSAIENPPVMAAAPALSMSLILALPGTEGGPMQLLDEAFVEVDRDGRTLKYRYNAILFHEPVMLMEDVPITGNGTAGMLSGTLDIPANHPLNPYRHRYHPEHRDGHDITRAITIEFLASDPDPINQALGLSETDGDNELTGLYSEVISGVSLEPITVSGVFRLHRLSDTTDLQGTP